jgi:hypothetical protein
LWLIAEWTPARGEMAHSISLGLEGVILHYGYTRTKRVRDAPRSLLHNMLKLMAEEELAMGCVGVVLPMGEMDL